MDDEKKSRQELLDELTELRRRLAELETMGNQQGELLRIFRASSPIGLFIIQDGKFVFVNGEFYGYTGAKAGELLGTDPMTLVHPEDRQMVRDKAIRMLKGERSKPYKYRLINKSGEVRWNLEGVASIQYRGKRAVLGHTMDITERERSESKLAELYEKERAVRKELEAEVQRRIEFTRALVHELKTPLTPILASSELLAAELREEPWLSLANNIHRGALNLSKRIDELLDLAKVEIGTLQVSPKAIDARQLLRAIADDTSALILGNKQTMIVDLPRELPLIWADEERIRQVVLNLLINASKFTPEGGQITLRAYARDSDLVVAVQDNGPGIAPEEQERLFQPYHREVSDREHLSGLGLGLALSKNLVELQGGKIWVESMVGKGSTFAFAIPLASHSAMKAGDPR